MRIAARVTRYVDVKEGGRGFCGWASVSLNDKRARDFHRICRDDPTFPELALTIYNTSRVYPTYLYTL